MIFQASSHRSLLHRSLSTLMTSKTGWSRQAMAASSAIAALTVVAFVAHAAESRTFSGIARVIHGDAIEIHEGRHERHHIRIACIDAPKLGQAFSQAARDNLAAIIGGRPVTATCHERDRYQQERFQYNICRVTVDGQDVGLAQIRAGAAWWSTECAGEQAPDESARYERAESGARARHIGLWGNADPVPPWQWLGARVQR